MKAIYGIVPIYGMVLFLFALIPCGEAFADDKELLRSIGAATKANALGFRNFEISYRVNSQTTTEPADKAAEPYVRKAYTTQLGRVWIDFEAKRFVSLKQDLHRKESTIESDLQPIPTRMMFAGGNVEEFEIDYRKGFVEQSGFQFKDGKLIGTMPSRPPSAPETKEFWESVKRARFLRAELLSSTGGLPILITESPEQYFAKFDQNSRPAPFTIRRAEDGSIVVITSIDKLKFETFYSPEHLCPTRKTRFHLMNGQEQLFEECDIQYDDYELIDRPLRTNCTSKYENQKSFATGEMVNTQTVSSTEIQWRQFNEEELVWPEFDPLVKSKDKFEQAINDGWPVQPQ